MIEVWKKRRFEEDCKGGDEEASYSSERSAV